VTAGPKGRCWGGNVQGLVPQLVGGDQKNAHGGTL